jgi:hypothetical protein
MHEGLEGAVMSKQTVVKVIMSSFMSRHVIRKVLIPDYVPWSEIDVIDKLEMAFRYGQNHVQEYKKCCSLSVGDVIVLDGDHYVIGAIGFYKILGDKKEVKEFIKELDESAVVLFSFPDNSKLVAEGRLEKCLRLDKRDD